ncbi:hypothetical protein Sjap_004480 [Stephania japonica]|uniref:Protein kinase domain-containing protein n=1 Tax=Stephania japonica TaxID=461633 RepID=A0AAP0PHV6_9MAGN
MGARGFDGDFDIWSCSGYVGHRDNHSGVVHFDAFVSRVELGKMSDFVFTTKYVGVDKLAELMPNADEDAISLIRCLCSWDDRKRPTALEALRHPFFASHYCIPKSIEIHLMGLKNHLKTTLARDLIVRRTVMSRTSKL